MFHTVPFQISPCRVGRRAARRQARATKAPTRVKRQAFGLTDFAAFLLNFSSFFDRYSLEGFDLRGKVRT
jgi:hypothetical protein